MKKLSVIFIAIILLVLSACSGNKNKLYDLEREIDDLEISDCKVKRLLLLDV